MTNHRAVTGRRKRAGALCAATLVAAGLTFGAGVALAEDPPPIDSDECVALVDADATVKAAVDARAKAAAALNLLGADDDGFEAAQALVATLGVKIGDARAKATIELCSDPVDEQPTEDPDPTTDPTTDPDLTTDPTTEPAEDPTPAQPSDDDDTPAVTDEVDPTDDDGSTADVDGTQIKIVPQGSVDTGGA